MLPLVTTHRLAPTANLASPRPAHEPLHGTQLQLFYEDAGISLEALLRERGKLPLAEAATILRQALQALAHCHGQGERCGWKSQLWHPTSARPRDPPEGCRAPAAAEWREADARAGLMGRKGVT